MKLFELDKIFPLYPASRLHFDFDLLVKGPHFDSLLDELAN